jgi:hypothetical protein
MCVRRGRYRVLRHLIERMDRRGLFWGDVEAVIDAPSDVVDGGLDDFGRSKWRICGQTTDRMDLEVVCVLDRDERGHLTIFITAFWG